MSKLCTLALCLTLLSTQASAANNNISSPQEKLFLHIGKSVLVNLQQAAHTVFIAEPEIASYQVPVNNRLLIFGRKTGSTTLYATNAAGSVIYSTEIKVEQDTVTMQEALKKEFPALSLTLTSTLDAVAVSGKVPDPQTATHVISLLDAFIRPNKEELATSSGGDDTDKGGSDSKKSAGRGKGVVSARNGRVINRLTVDMPNQVTIRVRIAEINRTLRDKLGFKWQALGGRLGLVESPVAFGNQVANYPKQTASFQNKFFNSTFDVAGLIDALAEENLISVLAEPNLSVLSGETASFLAGGQLPFPVLQDRSIGVEFRDFGVLLGITPTILSANRISLKVRPEVSQPDYNMGITLNGHRLPGLTVRRAETTVELASGQSFALAGLLHSEITERVAKLPGAGDIPILGALARSNEFKRGETELVIIATAYIAQPGDAELAIPNAQAEFGSTLERLFLMRPPRVHPGDPDQPAPATPALPSSTATPPTN